MAATQIIITDDSELDGLDFDDEVHVFYVFAAGDDGDAVGDVRTLRSEQAAIEAARRWARRLHMPFSWE